MLRLLKNHSGFTFIEAILVTALLSIGLWGGLAIFQNITTNTLESDMRVIASQLASEKIETIIADKTFQGYNWIIETNYPDETLTGAQQGFSRQVNITEVSSVDLSTPSPGSGFKKVDVLVTWGPENYQTIVVSTMVTDYT